MKTNELKKLEGSISVLPEKGWVMAYLRRKVVLYPYNNGENVSIDDILNYWDKDELLELHIFGEKECESSDKEKTENSNGKKGCGRSYIEYRAVRSESQYFKNRNSGWVEHIADSTDWDEFQTFRDENIALENRNNLQGFPYKTDKHDAEAKKIWDLCNKNVLSSKVLTVLNHLDYDERGMAFADDYILVIDDRLTT